MNEPFFHNQGEDPNGLPWQTHALLAVLAATMVILTLCFLGPPREPEGGEPPITTSQEAYEKIRREEAAEVEVGADGTYSVETTEQKLERIRLRDLNSKKAHGN